MSENRRWHWLPLTILILILVAVIVWMCLNWGQAQAILEAEGWLVQLAS